MENTKNKPMLITSDLIVNGYDIDVMGVVSNIVYVRWFEDLRLKFLDTYYPFQKMFEDKKSPIIATTEVKYKYPITIFDKPRGYLWVNKMGRSKWVMDMEIRTEDKIHCLGRQTGAYYDLVKKRPTAIPQVLMDKFNECVAKSST